MSARQFVPEPPLEEDGPSERYFACPVCGALYEWPGLVERHLLAQHEFEEEVAA